MKKVLISYFSRTGKTQQMAEYIAEGLRITGHDVDVKKISEIKSEKELSGYDGYLFGAPPTTGRFRRLRGDLSLSRPEGRPRR